MRRTLAALCAVLLLLGIGASSAGAYTNGVLPESELAPIATTVKCPKPEGQLANDAAASWNSMALAAGRPLAINGCDSAYRPLSRQVFWQVWWCAHGNCGNAATPGTSNHGWGKAADVPTAEQGYLHLHGKRFRWEKIEAFSEPWHWNYVGGYNRPNPGPNLKYPRLRRHSGGPGQNIYVRKAQKLLRGHGFKQLTVDGEFGRSTMVAVRRFQKGQRIPVTGVVNKTTWKRLRRPVSKPVATTPKHVPAISGGTKAPAGKPTKKPTKHKPKKHHHKRPKGKAWGPDISSNNGPVTYSALKAAGASFVIVKATESTGYINPYFTRDHIRAITKAGLVPGAYDFLRPEAGHTGAAEAAFFTNAIGHAGFGKGWLPPVADIEVTELGDRGTCHYLAEWVHTVKRNLGVRPMIYTSYSFPQDAMAGCDWLRHFQLWNAHPGSSPLVGPPWSDWTIWQYSWTGSVRGAGGAPMDLNKVKGGRGALVDLRVRPLPKRATARPRARLELPLAAESRQRLRAAAPPPAAAEPLAEVPAPEGELIVPAPATPEAAAAAPSPLAELINALLRLVAE